MTELDFSVRVNQRFVRESGRPFAMLGGGEKMSGAVELGRTSRCLNRMYPNELQRAILREPLVAEMLKHFGKKAVSGSKKGAARKPVVLVGPSQTGKTAIVHEFLRRRLDDETTPRQELWHLNPQRLISGMSYVGQWEERVLAIFEESALRRHLLFFDDLLGLFQAGKSRDSELTIGHVLKGFLEEGRLRVVAEATPEVWRKLREVDRGFADFFCVIHVREPSDPETLRILVRSMQEMESLYGCEFDASVLPAILQLQRRYVRARAFPGKAVEMLRQLAHGHKSEPIDTFDVFDHFEKKTGVRQQFLNVKDGIELNWVRDFFQGRIVAQQPAVDAMIDAVSRSAAQLNDPTRPLASLLFLGPTGVGKTECVKALAEYFFGRSQADGAVRYERVRRWRRCRKVGRHVCAPAGPPHRCDSSPALRGGLAGRDRKGSLDCIRSASPGSGRRTSHRCGGRDGRLLQLYCHSHIESRGSRREAATRFCIGIQRRQHRLH